MANPMENIYIPIAELSLQERSKEINSRNPAATQDLRSSSTARGSSSGRVAHLKPVNPDSTIAQRPLRLEFNPSRQLVKPHLRPVNWDEVEELYPHLEGIPPEYIRDKLVGTGWALLKIIEGTKVFSAATSKGLPTHLVINLPPGSAPPPTHVLATFVPNEPNRISYHPTYALVIAVYCGSLSPLLFSDPASAISTEKAMIPVIPLRLPEPSLFYILHGYLLTRDRAGLFQSLMSCPRKHYTLFSDPKSQKNALAYLKENKTFQDLMTSAKKVHAFWANMCILEVCDDALWVFVGQMWDLISTALNALKAMR